MSIRQIAQYDKDHNTKYIPTLKAWLVSGSRLKETSDILHMHRNSVSYRLQKIQEEFSLNLDDSSMRQESSVFTDISGEHSVMP